MVLGEFPELGHLLPDFGEETRRVSYREFSFVYRFNEGVIEILTIYRENLP